MLSPSKGKRYEVLHLREVVVATLVFAGTYSVLVQSDGLAGIVDQSPHRKVQNGVGNCIFAGSPLEFGKDASYKGLRTAFAAPEDVFARCYFPGQIKDYEARGRVANSLRASGTYWTYFEIQNAKGEKKYHLYAPWVYDEEVKLRDQSRYDIHRTEDLSDCSFQPNKKCLNLPEKVRKAAMEDGGKFPYTSKVCLTTYLMVADNRKAIWDETAKALIEKPVEENLHLSSGCFTYTLNQ